MRSQKRYILVITGLFFIIILLLLTLNYDNHQSDVDNLLSTNSVVSNGLVHSPVELDKVNFNKQCLKGNSGNIITLPNSLNINRSHANRNNQPYHNFDTENFYSKFYPQYSFSECSMSDCFDFSRCQTLRPIKVHIVPSKQHDPNGTVMIGESNLIHNKILEIIRNSENYEPNPENACIFVLEDDTLDRDPLSKSFRQNLNNIFNQDNHYGVNHLVFNLYSGTWPNYKEDDFAGMNIGAAILAKASMSITNHRPNFDISIPLFSYLHPFSDNEYLHSVQIRDDYISNSNTSYFLTFKGKRYVFGSGSETRNNLYHLNNNRDVIMLTTCRHGKKWRESNDKRCLLDEANYDKYDFENLMKLSTFCLVPRGRRLGSFRFLEALAHGCVPVVLSDGWVWPFDEIIDWSCATVQYDEKSLLLVPDLLRDIDKQTILRMKINCKLLYDEFFSSMEKIIMTTFSVIESRIQEYQSSYNSSV